MKILAIDGNSIINRAFYGIRLLSNKEGVFTNAVTGFMNIYLKLIGAYSPDGAVAAFDLKAPTFRHKQYDAYKAGRHQMPDELFMQLPYVKELLSALGVHVIECEGYEADDILGTVSAACDRGGHECIIATGDRDSLQLVTDRVFVNLAANKEDILYTPEKLFEVYGVSPAEMIEVKALMGDSSDNIPGVAGIGEKTALSLISKYHSIDNIYADIEGIDVTKSVREKLKKGEESARLSHMLGTIVKNVPVSTDPASYLFGERDEAKLASILTELEMFGVMKKLKLSQEALNAAAENTAREKAQRDEKSVIDDEITFDESIPDYILDDGTLYRCDSGGSREADGNELSEEKEKRTFDIKDMLSRLDTPVSGVSFDTTLAAYLLNTGASDYSMERLCGEYSAVFDKDNPAGTVRELNRTLTARLHSQGMDDILKNIEIPLARVLVSMEKEGALIDRAALTEFGKKLSEKAAELEEKVCEAAGEKFDVASPKQLGVILFEKLGLKSGKKTKTGYSTDASVLEALSGEHPIIDLISEYRAVTKLDSTYAQGLLKVIADDGRVHTTYKQTETRTGRISSAEPNIQNIPVRTELGREFRRFFIAKDGCTLVDADYSQIELRILAHMSGDKTMIEAFNSGEDIHTVTASQVFGMPPEWITPEMRRSAKAVNFGIVYGIGAFSLSKDIGVPLSEADAYIKAYLKKYSGVDAFMKKTVEDGKKNGYVSTMWGRRRYIPELSATNKTVQALGKRMAMNAPIQGTAADIIKLAMIRVYQRLIKEKLDARLILQVHDELIVEAALSCAQQVRQLLTEEMENAAKLSVPLTVDAKCGRSWYDAH